MNNHKNTLDNSNETYILGIKNNLNQFLQQLVQVFFVGLTIGLERNVIPLIAEQEFGVARTSFTLLMAFIISFGFVKGSMNFVAGRMSETYGRRKVLIWGWLVAIPIPFVIYWAPSWSWIVFANVLLGINQGFAWSMTVTAKVDITKASERGLATGFNEFAGYGGVAIAGVVTGYMATAMDPRFSLFIFGITIIVLALISAVLFSKETLPWAKAEAARHKAGTHDGPTPRFPEGVSDAPSKTEIFKLVTYQHKTFMSLSQAGCVEKFVDALVWAFYPIYFFSKGLSMIQIGWMVGIYGMVWGASQLWTGPLSDKIGRKIPIVLGMWVAGLGVLMTVSVAGVFLWSVAAVITGVGMALLYPTLIASVSDISHPHWRGSSLGVYRFWRDMGYAIGALSIGVIADYTNSMESGFWFTGIAMGLSGLWVLLVAEETHPHLNPAEDNE